MSGGDPVADLLVGLLSLLGGGGDAGADGPDGLVGNHARVGLEDVLCACGEGVDDQAREVA